MKADQYSRIDSIKVKARADYKCQRCGSDEAIQAHAPNGDHTNWRKGIALCGEHHADEHPDVPRSLFLSSEKQPYWHNISARALAIECHCHARTVIRRAKVLGIASNCALSDSDKKRIKSSILNPEPKPKKQSNNTTIQVHRDTLARLSKLAKNGESYEATIKKLLEGGKGEMRKHKSYIVRWGHNAYRVHAWDEAINCYRESQSMPYFQARLAVGEENCKHATDGLCDKITHLHPK